MQPGPIALPALNNHDTVTQQHALHYDNKDKTDLDDGMKETLTGVASAVKQTQGNVRVVAYASGSAEEASVARRISMARALQIRAFLIDKGVNAMSINVQALGNQKNEDKAEVLVK